MDTDYILFSVITLFSASFLFVCSFLYCQFTIKSALHGMIKEKDISSISMRIVSALQGVCCTASGLVIIHDCQDLIHERHWLTETYVMIGTGYLVYDTWATFVCFKHSNADVKGLPLVASIVRFIRHDLAMMFHHICLPMVYLPTVMYYRKGVGDGLIGCFMLIEACVPFISFREILVLLNRQKTWLYFANGILTLLTYTASRILIFPWMFWLYGRQIDKPWYEVPFLLHRVCIIGTATFAVLYTYWWVMIFGIARQELKEWFGDSRTRVINGKKTK